jgi:hypothetical protein
MSLRRGPVAATFMALALALGAAAFTSAASSATATAAHSLPGTAAHAARLPLVAFLRYSGGSPSIVWIARPTGLAERRLGPGGQPLVSPAGGHYVAASGDNSKGRALLIYSTMGGSPRSFFSSGQVSAEPLAWSADGRYLAVALLGTSVNSTRGSGLAVIDTSTWTATIVAKGIIYGASFDPTQAGKLVFASASSQLLNAPSNLRTVSPHGGSSTLLTHDGRSLNPVWGAKGIVFDREILRGVSKAPEYQLWLMHGSESTELTSLKIGPLVDGLVPLAMSADGNRIVAEYVGEDTDEAWAVQIAPRSVKQVKVGKQYVQAAGISTDGTRLLVDVGDFEQSSSRGAVDTLAFTGDHVVKVTQGADSSWNG